ncbi:MAG: hypothetical protein K8823_1534 [Cenarchaeum symbiont of Oopsacas minuta]|nr:hypothetical protein [Cenarchaeum symbiont of Oopsacas minuta]
MVLENGIRYHLPCRKALQTQGGPEIRVQLNIAFARTEPKVQQLLRENHMLRKHDQWEVSACFDCRNAVRKQGYHIPHFTDLPKEKQCFPGRDEDEKI